jgi:predicted nucleic acid-binding protein
VAGPVCVDASLALKWILPEDLSGLADALLEAWRRDEVTLFAPSIFQAEVTSIIRERAFRGDISIAGADTLLESALRWPITVPASFPRLQRIALGYAHRFNRPKAYDAQYLALAEVLGCELWTGDRRLVNSLQGALPWVKWVGEFQG